MTMKNLQKKFAKNLYFNQVTMVSNTDVHLSGIKPALEKYAKKDSEIQHEKEQILIKRISKYLGFEPQFSINY